jgi:hypothetical protein
MVNWDLSQRETDTQVQQKSVRRNRATTLKRRKTLSRPLVEPNHNAHLLHVGRRNNTINKNGKKLRIRRVVRESRPLKSSQPSFLID